MAMPIIPWIGGKRRLADVLIPRFPPHTCYVEVFAGAAALFFMRPPAEVEVLNDVNDELVNLYRVVQHHLEEFVRQFKWALTSRQVFRWLQDTRPETLTDIQRAARFYYLQQNCFGGRVEARTFGTATTSTPGLNLLRLEETLSAAHLRLSGAYIEKLDWHTCMTRYDRPHTFFFDPPYLETEGYGVPFEFSEYKRIAAVLKELQGRAILTLNDHVAFHDLFAGFQRERVELQYTVGGPANTALRGELIIYSWDRAKDPVGLF
ncbi:DNA adenine methylase [Paraburkholderia tropica]|uniref:DNA adenine methylase n=1 Tax=Paraburkholderia tropica TaxID=92647 RepID=UPI002AB749E8|nr:DNA adenine methylase [Paraburkholderia tropica]